MSNPYYGSSGAPSTGSSLSSSAMRSEFAAIEDAFDLLPILSGNGSKVVVVNSGGTALEAVSTLTNITLVTPALGTPSSGNLANCTFPTFGVTTGGTGRTTSTTAYGLIAAGTTATGAHQTLPAGLTTEILVGGGASALPVWTAATGSGAPVRANSPTIASPTFSGSITEGVYTITDGAGFEIDPANGTIQVVVLGANRTPKGTNFAAGQSVTLHVDDGSDRTLTWTDATFGSGGVTWVGGVVPTLATTGYTVITLWKVGSKVYGTKIGEVA